jgi:hypothetical protein
MTYSCGRVMSILSWRRATCHGGEHEIKMGKYTQPFLSPCLLTPHTCKIFLPHNPPISVLIIDYPSHSKVNVLSLQVLASVQLYMWPLSPPRVSVDMHM